MNVSFCTVSNYFSIISSNILRANTHQLEMEINTKSRACGLELKAKQAEAIFFFVQGHNTFVSLPTGYGKSSLLPGEFVKMIISAN